MVGDLLDRCDLDFLSVIILVCEEFIHLFTFCFGSMEERNVADDGDDDSRYCGEE